MHCLKFSTTTVGSWFYKICSYKEPLKPLIKRFSVLRTSRPTEQILGFVEKKIMMTNVMTSGENDPVPACSIYFIDLINQKLLRLQLFEKDNFNCPEIYAPGVITPKGLRAFVTSFCNASLLPLCVGKEENCMPFLDTKNFDAYMLRSKTWPNPNRDNIYIAMIPKKFGESIDSPFSTPMEFDYHDLDCECEE